MLAYKITAPRAFVTPVERLFYGSSPGIFIGATRSRYMLRACSTTRVLGIPVVSE